MTKRFKPDILKGVRVLDFTRVLAGPYATRIFADFGAEVIKVEPRIKVQGADVSRSAYFRTWNRNKHSITVDMTHPGSKELIKRLIHLCDILVENFSPRVMGNWGLGYETLREIRPDLIMLSMSGFGQSGPWKDYVAYAPTVHALGGLTYMTAEREGEPMGPGFAYGDIMSGLFGAFAVLAALENRHRTGEGEYIDLSEYEVICSLMGPALLETDRQGKSPVPNGNRGDNEPAPHGCYSCKGEDRWCVLVVHNEAEWKSLCKIVNPALASDERFMTSTARQAHYHQLDAEIEGWTRNQTPEEAVRILQGGGIPSGVVQNACEVAEDTQHTLRNFFVKNTAAVGDPIQSDVTPLLMERHVPVEWQDAPEAGEANAYICRELLGMSEEEYHFHVQEGVIG